MLKTMEPVAVGRKSIMSSQSINRSGNESLSQIQIPENGRRVSSKPSNELIDMIFNKRKEQKTGNVDEESQQSDSVASQQHQPPKKCSKKKVTIKRENVPAVEKRFNSKSMKKDFK